MPNPEQKFTKVTHLQFIQAVDAVRKHKQRFLDERPGNAGTGELLSRLCGFKISIGTAASIREASGVVWTTRQKERDGNGNRFSSFNAVATLARAVSSLYTKLGEEKPAELVAVLDHYQS